MKSKRVTDNKIIYETEMEKTQKDFFNAGFGAGFGLGITVSVLVGVIGFVVALV